MRFNGIGWQLLLALGVVFAQSRLSAQAGQVLSGSPEDAKVSVFFGTAKAMDVGEIRTNALTALKAKGHIVPQGASCVINISVAGAEPGCAVMFWDLERKWTYQVVFNVKGQARDVSAGPMRHGTVGPNDPLPKVPEGGVKVKP